MAFKCTVATPEGLLFDNSANSATIPAHDGQVGILTDHAPILVKLGAGLLTIDGGGARTSYFISGGVAQMKDNVLTVLSDEAITTDKLDVESARKELAELANTGAGDLTSRSRRVTRARAVLRVAGVAVD
jgi:F-type H+-transporting ATPase subunit epsilon